MNWRVWWQAARPKTLWASTAPVLMATAMAWQAGALHVPSVVAALVGAVLIQVGTNFANDYFDFVKGADTGARIGPVRATQAGHVSPATMRRATLVVFALVLIPGTYIMARGGWPFVVIGALSILFGVLYTAGPYPLAYVGVADVFVLVFFGPVAVGGTYYLQALAIDWTVLVAGLAPGLLSVALLTVNNLRDIEEDRRAMKRTPAVRFGRTFARIEYVSALALGAVVIPVVLALGRPGHAWVLASMLAILAARPAVRTVLTRTDGPALNQALAQTGKLLLVFSVLFSLGWVL